MVFLQETTGAAQDGTYCIALRKSQEPRKTAIFRRKAMQGEMQYNAIRNARQCNTRKATQDKVYCDRIAKDPGMAETRRFSAQYNAIQNARRCNATQDNAMRDVLHCLATSSKSPEIRRFLAQGERNTACCVRCVIFSARKGVRHGGRFFQKGWISIA